jgi:hypothetical protein
VKDHEAELQAKYGAKFDEICDLISRQLGYGEKTNLSDDVRQIVVDEG